MRVQEKRKRLRRPQKKVDDPERISILSGLVKCPVCGTGMITKKNKRKNNNHGAIIRLFILMDAGIIVRVQGVSVIVAGRTIRKTGRSCDGNCWKGDRDAGVPSDGYEYGW